MKKQTVLKILSLLLVFALVLGVAPHGQMLAYATGEPVQDCGTPNPPAIEVGNITAEEAELSFTADQDYLIQEKATGEAPADADAVKDGEPIVDKTLVSITTPSAITGVANGTPKTAEALGLPLSVVMATYDENVNADVIWDVDASSYDVSIITEQTFSITGTVSLPEGVVNPNNSIALITTISVTVDAAVPTVVYEVSDTSELSSALETLHNGQGGTVRLLEDIDYPFGILVDGVSVCFDLNGKTLNVTEAAGHGLTVKNGGRVTLSGAGELNVKTISSLSCGVYADGSGSRAEVTHVELTGFGGVGAYAVNSGTVIVGGDITAFDESAEGKSEDSIGASADGGEITVEGTIYADIFVLLSGVEKTTAQCDRQEEAYLVYENDNSKVRVKINDLSPYYFRTVDGQKQVSWDGKTWNALLMGTPDPTIEVSEDTEKYLQWANQAIVKLSEVSGVPVVGTISTMVTGLFGSKTDKQIILEALQKISEQIEAVQFMLGELSKQVTMQDMNARINDYYKVVTKYKVQLRNLDSLRAKIENEPNEAKQVELSKNFLLDIQNHVIEGETDFHNAVLNLGEEILRGSENAQVLGTNGLFAASDKLALLAYKWEHQGYLSREALRADALGNYVALAAYSMMGLAAQIEKETDTYQKLKLINKLENLQAQIDKIAAMSEKYPVVRRPDNLRYYQVPGRTLLLEANADCRYVNKTKPTWQNWLNWKTSGHFAGLLNNELGYTNPTTDWLTGVYKDYGKSKWLFDIIFDKDEGNFTYGGFAPTDITLPRTTRFATSTFWISKTFAYLQTVPAQGTFSASKDDIEVAIYFLGDIYAPSNQMFIGLNVLPPNLQGGNGSGFAITGMESSYRLPYSGIITLSVGDTVNMDYLYTWQVDKGNGFELVSEDELAYMPNYTINSVDSSMNGYQYRCVISHYNLDGVADAVTTKSVTLNLIGSSSSSGGGSRGTSAPAQTPKTETNVSGNIANATTTAKATVDNSGNAAATVTRTQVSDAIGKVMEEAGKQGEGTVTRVEIKVEAPADVAAVGTSIPKEAVSQASEAGIGALTISTPVASITFDANALSALPGEATGDVKITASKVDAASLSPEAQQTVGHRPVFDFSVTSGDKTISQFGGDVLVSVPYTLKEGEDTNAIVIYYINDSGKLEIVSNCIYDSATGRISFSTRHFSQYAVGYNKVTFKDVAESAWYSKPVGFIAAREITTGIGGGNFGPEVKLTRGQFIVMLMKAYGIAPDADPKDNFADAGDTYYTGYLAAAKRLSISGGVGNNMFIPDREITRQEMFTLLYNALKTIGRLPEGTAGKPLSAFTDTEDIASWAREAMALLVETGVIGGNRGKLSPTSTTTRAEMAQVLYNLLSK
jgi:hypothetical protein